MAYNSKVNLLVICIVCFLPYCASIHCTNTSVTVKCVNETITNIRSFVDNLTSLVTTLAIYDGNIGYLNGSDFKNLKRLNHLVLRNLKNLTIGSDVFINHSSLRTVEINNTSLSEYPTGVFRNNSKLNNIDLSYNRLKSLDVTAFDGLSDLLKLKLNNNNIRELNASIFTSCHRLENLNLGSNQLSLLHPEIFQNLSKVVSIDLHSNFLQELKPGTFNSCVSLKFLNVSNNCINTLSQDVFIGVYNLTILKLRNNSISHLRRGTFDFIDNLRELYVEDNPLKYIDDNIWDKNIVLEKVLLDYYTFTCVLGSSAKLLLSSCAFVFLTFTQKLRDCDSAAVYSRSTCNETLGGVVSSGTKGTLDPRTTDTCGQSNGFTVSETIIIIIISCILSLFFTLLAYLMGNFVLKYKRRPDDPQSNERSGTSDMTPKRRESRVPDEDTSAETLF